MNKIAVWVLLLVFCAAYSQELPVLTGRVTADTLGVANVFVINRQAGTEVKTDTKGNFSIGIKPGQTLVVYSDNTVAREFYISADSFKNPPYVVAVEIKGFEIEEVVINQTITSESLGLVPKGQKRYSPEEKRAMSYKGNTRGISGVVNFFRGRLFLEKIKAKYAVKEVHLFALQRLYTEEQLVRDFSIPALYAKAFYYFAIDDERVVSMLQANEPGAVRLILAEVAMKYLDTLKEDE